MSKIFAIISYIFLFSCFAGIHSQCTSKSTSRSRPLLSPFSAAVFGVNTDAAGVVAVGNKKEKRRKITLWQLQLDSLPSEHNYAHSFCKFLSRRGLRSVQGDGGRGVVSCSVFVEFGQVLATTRQVNATRCCCCRCRLPTGGNFDLAFLFDLICVTCGSCRSAHY